MNKHIPQWLVLIVVLYYLKHRRNHMWKLQISNTNDVNSENSQFSINFQDSSDLETCTDAVSIKHIETDFENRTGLQKKVSTITLIKFVINF